MVTAEQTKDIIEKIEKTYFFIGKSVEDLERFLFQEEYNL